MMASEQASESTVRTVKDDRRSGERASEGRINVSAHGIALLAPTVVFIIWIAVGAWVRPAAELGRDFVGSAFSANTMVMALMWLGYLMTLINLLFYVGQVFREHREISHRKTVLAAAGMVIWIISLFVGITVAAFLGARIKYFTYEEIGQYNYYILLFIFTIFLGLDWLEFRSASRRTDAVEYEIRTAWLSIYLVSVPNLVITFVGFLLYSRLTSDPNWKLIFDKPEVLSGAAFTYLHPLTVRPSPTELPLFGLFASGLNIGFVMASIIVSQWTFFIVQVHHQKRFNSTSVISDPQRGGRS